MAMKLNSNLSDIDLPVDFPQRERVRITVSCKDCESLPKVEGAGDVFQSDSGCYQLMHNGVMVVLHGYHDEWMAEVIKRLHGHHEPQEERAFYEVLNRVPAEATMLELGGFWSYYSLWFHHQIGGRNYIVEPDPVNIELGKSNFALNGFQAEFLQAAVGAQSAESISFPCESDWQMRPIPQICVDDFVEEKGIEKLDVLHADIQGAELEMLQGARRSIEAQKIRFLFLSTHHHSVSKDPLTHQRCCEFLRESGAHILTEHTVAESYSGDGLVVASFSEQDRDMGPIPISYNRASNNIFREVEYDLADVWDAFAKSSA